MDGRMDGRMDGWKEGWMEGWMDGWMEWNRWIDRCLDRYTNVDEKSSHLNTTYRCYSSEVSASAAKGGYKGH